MPDINCLYKIEFTNEGSSYHSFCDIDPYIFSDGFIGELYLEAHIAESPEDIYEEGEENGEGEFVPSFKRGVKQYILRTGLITAQTVDLIYFLRLLTRVELTLLTGEVVEMKNLSITHEWQFEDKQEATVEITFDMDEIITKTACCIL